MKIPRASSRSTERNQYSGITIQQIYISDVSPLDMMALVHDLSTQATKAGGSSQRPARDEPSSRPLRTAHTARSCLKSERKGKVVSFLLLSYKLSYTVSISFLKAPKLQDGIYGSEVLM